VQIKRGAGPSVQDSRHLEVGPVCRERGWAKTGAAFTKGLDEKAKGFLPSECNGHWDVVNKHNPGEDAFP